ncbi:MAG: polysaccharide deacetylase [Actinomycetota bacterium]|nr:MAG: polysaccharide deacetylase [Actinomycetota bacterium]
MPDRKAQLSIQPQTGDALKASRGKDNRNWSLPNGARIAVWVVVNIEDFDLRYPIDGGESVPDYREYAIREYGNRAGMARIIAELDRFNIRGTGAVNASFARNFPHWMVQCANRGWDMMGHGDYNNRKMHTYPPDEEKELITAVLDDIERVWGHRPVGWLSPGLQQSEYTLSELAAAGVGYVADFVADDRPFEIPIAGTSLISVPYSMDINDKGAYGRACLTPEGFQDMIISQFDELYRDGESSPTVMVIAVHPYLTGLPYRIKALRGAIEYISSREGVWWATGAEIARRYREFL